jgi:hypothetical protein
MNQILTQKWFLLQNIKDSSLDRNGVFNNGERMHIAVACWPSFGKNFQIKIETSAPHLCF